jgi:hypothetical protein
LTEGESPTESTATCYARSADSEILWKSVDEGWMSFDIASGSTQLMSELAKFIVEILSERGLASEAELLSAAQLEDPESASPDDRAAVVAAIDSLVQAELLMVVRR